MHIKQSPVLPSICIKKILTHLASQIYIKCCIYIIFNCFVFTPNPLCMYVAKLIRSLKYVHNFPEIFFFSGQERWKWLFLSTRVNISVKQHIYGFCCWLNYFPLPVFSASTGNWIIAFETWFTAATVFFPPPFDFKDLATLSYSNVCIITFYCWP